MGNSRALPEGERRALPDRPALGRIALIAIPLAGLVLAACSSSPAGDTNQRSVDAASDQPTEAVADASADTREDALDGSANDVADGSDEDQGDAGEPDVFVDDAPNESGDDAPNESGDDAPNESGDDAPSESGDDAPNETGDDAPNESGDDAPSESGDDAPNESGDDASADVGLEEPDVDQPDSDQADTGQADASLEDGSGGDAAVDGPGVACDGAPPPLKLTKLWDGLPGVLLVTAPPGDPSRLFLVRQAGVIRVAKQGVLLAQPFLDVSGIISTGGERGLLGLAFHPGYTANGRFWINYTNAAGNSVVAEYARAAGDGDLAEPAAVRQLFTVTQPAANHNGGMLAFGPDGYLYVGMGDGGSGGDPWGNGQKLDSQLGKLLRVDVDAYPSPPPGNMSGPGVDPQIWAYGLRNPWRFSFDSQTGDLYIGDVGQGEREEIDVAPSGVGGQNYGWNVMEGTVCYPPGTACDSTGMTAPAAEYTHADGCSITGGYVYRGHAIPCLRGRYLYADYCSRRIFSFIWSGGAAHDAMELTDELQSATLVSGLSSFGQGADGELYVCSSNNGTVYRIDP